MSLKAASAIKSLSSLLGDSPEEAGCHSCVLLESVVAVLGAASVQVRKEKGVRVCIDKAQAHLAIPVSGGSLQFNIITESREHPGEFIGTEKELDSWQMLM